MKKFQALAVLFLFLFILPGSVASQSVPVESFELDNGMRFLLVRRPGAPMVAAGWVARVGSGDEKPGATGLSHLLEHLMFQGTRRLRQGEYARIYTEAGAVGMNAVTDRDFTMYYGLIPSGKLELWFWMESDRLLSPSFPEFDKEVRIVEEERRQRLESTPTGLVGEQLLGAFWEGHPYSWPAIGRPEDLKALRRERAEEYFQAHYAPGRLTAAIVGDFDPEEVKALARAYFGRVVREARPAPVTPELPAQTAERRMTGACDCQPQARVLYRTVPFGHADGAALDVLSGLLNGRTGRLHRALVLDRQAAFSAWTLHEPGRRGGLFTVTAEAKGGVAPAKLVEAWEEELSRLRSGPIPDEELQKVKNQITTDAWRRLQEPLGLALRLLIYDAQGDWTHLNRWPEAALAVKAEDIYRVIDLYFKPANRTVGLFERAGRGVGR